MFPVCIPALCLNMVFAPARIRKEWGYSELSSNLEQEPHPQPPSPQAMRGLERDELLSVVEPQGGVGKQLSLF